MAGQRYVSSTTLPYCTSGWLAAVAPWARSRPLPALDRAALLVLDLQRYFADPASHAFLPALEAVLPNVLRLMQAFHAAGRPVVLTRHGSDGGAPHPVMQSWWVDELRQDEARWALMEPVARQPHDRVLDKTRYDAFHGTDLQRWLEDHDCSTVVITGVMTHLCCETTARQAFTRDLQPVVVADACASQDEELHLGALRGLAHGFAVVAGTDPILTALGEPAHQAPVAPAESVPTDSELVVVGAGPAGLAAAIQARRAGVKLWVLDATGDGGGHASTADWIENYPGFPGGLDGRSLMHRFLCQAREHTIQPLRHRVRRVQRQEHGLTLELEPGPRADRPRSHLARFAPHSREAPPLCALIQARAVILATGAVPRTPEVEGAELAVHRADALPRIRGQRILVVGGGEAALDQALHVQRRGARRVLVAIRGAAPRAMELLVQRARARDVELLLETRLLRLTRDAGGTLSATLQRSGAVMTLELDAVLLCVGQRPSWPELPPHIRLDADERPVVDRLGRSSVEGLYLVGDAVRGPYRQVAIAVGDGVAAAMHVTRYLKGERWEESC